MYMLPLWLPLLVMRTTSQEFGTEYSKIIKISLSHSLLCTRKTLGTEVQTAGLRRGPRRRPWPPPPSGHLVVRKFSFPRFRLHWRPTWGRLILFQWIVATQGMYLWTNLLCQGGRRQRSFVARQEAKLVRWVSVILATIIFRLGRCALPRTWHFVALGEQTIRMIRPPPMPLTMIFRVCRTVTPVATLVAGLARHKAPPRGREPVGQCSLP